MNEREKNMNRLRIWVRERFGSESKASEAVGMSVNYFGSFFRRGKLPPPSVLKILEREHGLDLEWLKTGEVTPKGLASEPVMRYVSQPTAIAHSEEVFEDIYRRIQVLGGLPMWSALSERERETAKLKMSRYQLRVEKHRQDYEHNVASESTALAEELLDILSTHFIKENDQQ